jgi:hypothetical protein
MTHSNLSTPLLQNLVNWRSTNLKGDLTIDGFKPAFRTKQGKFRTWLRSIFRKCPEVITLKTAEILREIDSILYSHGERKQFDEFYRVKYGETLHLVSAVRWKIKYFRWLSGEYYVHDDYQMHVEEITTNLRQVTRAGWSVTRELVNDLRAIDMHLQAEDIPHVFEHYWVVRHRA